MDTIECIKTRRSIRKYLSKPVPEEHLKEILEAVRWSPSWANTQCWELIVIEDDEIKRKLQGCLPPGNPARDAVIEAPILIAVCGRKGRAGIKRGEPVTVYGDWFMFDLGIASQNLCLCAHSLGLGTVHIGLFDHRLAGEILEVPDDVVVVELIPVGYAASEAKAPGRKPIEEFVHHNKFGGKKE